jgi:murein DD-endopeptidase MepM/ murein hydrolase activator NlpD
MSEDASSPKPPLTRRELKERERQRATERPEPADSSPIAVSRPPRSTSPTHEKLPALAPTAAPKAVPVSSPVTKPSAGRRVLSWGTIIATGLLFVGVSLPVNVFYGSSDINPAIVLEGENGEGSSGAQSFTVASSQAIQVGVQRESWSVTSFAEVLRAQYGSRNFSYSTSGIGSIRWPFPTAVPISSGYGDRVAPCRYCSSNHRGLDFIPGNGSPIFAIADGVVTASEYGGGYGQYAYIEHEINGQTVLSVYAHMQRNSSPLQVGDSIRAGDFIGLVGNTGISTGPHLHFEIRIEGEYVNPFTWLKANAF